MRGFIVAAILLVVFVSVFILAPRCHRQIGDPTDFPLFVLAGQAACGASTLLGGS